MPDLTTHDSTTATRAVVARHLDATGAAELVAAPVSDLLNQVAALPSMSRIDVYPDITGKTWGFPAGITTVSSGADPIVYPMAVPDVACGFLTVATGIPAFAWSASRKQEFLDAVVRAISVDSPHRAPVRMDLDAVFAAGAAALPAPAFVRNETIVEQTTTCVPRPELVLPTARADLAAEAGSVAGHFISLYAAHPMHPDADLEPGEVVLVVHTGAPALREQWLTSHALPMAQMCLDQDLLPPEVIEQGLFGLPLSHPLATEFLGLAACAVHWGQANRQLVANRILHLLTDHAPAPAGQVRLIRHVGHCCYQVHHTPACAAVTTARGIQPLTVHRDRRQAPAPSTFITGGSHTHAYLVPSPDRKRLSTAGTARTAHPSGLLSTHRPTSPARRAPIQTPRGPPMSWPTLGPPATTSAAT
ncbi:MAG: RtcB family protein [Sciscionella sp.]